MTESTLGQWTGQAERFRQGERSKTVSLSACFTDV